MYFRTTMTFVFVLGAVQSLQAGPLPAGTLYWTNLFGRKILHTDIASGQTQELLTAPAITRGLAVAPQSDLMIWSTAQPAGIFKSNLNGTEIEQIAPSCGELCNPGIDIAIDQDAGKFYWTEISTNSAENAVKRANFDGSEIEFVFPASARRPSGIELDLILGKIYWSERASGELPGRIRRANPDGTQIEDILNVGVNTPILEFDLKSGKMYWTNNQEGEIWRANLDGSDQQLLLNGLRNPLGLQLDLQNGFLFWSDNLDHIIGRASLDGSNPQTLISTGTHSPEGFAFVIPEPSSLLLILATCAGFIGVRLRASTDRSKRLAHR